MADWKRFYKVFPLPPRTPLCLQRHVWASAAARLPQVRPGPFRQEAKTLRHTRAWRVQVDRMTPGELLGACGELGIDVPTDVTKESIQSVLKARRRHPPHRHPPLATTRRRAQACARDADAAAAGRSNLLGCRTGVRRTSAGASGGRWRRYSRRLTRTGHARPLLAKT